MGCKAMNLRLMQDCGFDFGVVPDASQIIFDQMGAIGREAAASTSPASIPSSICKTKCESRAARMPASAAICSSLTKDPAAFEVSDSQVAGFPKASAATSDTGQRRC